MKWNSLHQTDKSIADEEGNSLIGQGYEKTLVLRTDEISDLGVGSIVNLMYDFPYCIKKA